MRGRFAEEQDLKKRQSFELFQAIQIQEQEQMPPLPYGGNVFKPKLVRLTFTEGGLHAPRAPQRANVSFLMCAFFR